MGIRASEEGIKYAESILQRHGWNKTSPALMEKANVSEGTLGRFWQRYPKGIKRENFESICNALGIYNWQTIVDFDSDIYFEEIRFFIEILTEDDIDLISRKIAQYLRMQLTSSESSFDISFRINGGLKGSMWIVHSGNKKEAQEFRAFLEAEGIGIETSLTIDQNEFARLIREKENVIPIELGAENLPFLDLSGGHLQNANLNGTNLEEANLTNADLSGATLNGVNLTNAILDGANLTGATLINVALDGASVKGADFTGATIQNSDLSYANLQGACFDNSMQSDVNYYYADLVYASLNFAQMSQINFHETKLDHSTFINSHLSDVYIAGTRITGTRFDGSVWENVHGTTFISEDTVWALDGTPIEVAEGIDPVTLQPFEEPITPPDLGYEWDIQLYTSITLAAAAPADDATLIPGFNESATAYPIPKTAYPFPNQLDVSQ